MADEHADTERAGGEPPSRGGATAAHGEQAAHAEHPIARMLVIGTVASVIGVGLTLLIQWFPPAASQGAHAVDTLYDVTLAIAIPIFVLVMTVAIYSVVRFRARPGDTRDGPPIHGNARLEVIWVAIPFLIVSALAAYSWIVLDENEARQPGALQVDVHAQQFAWSFQYPQPGRPPIQSDQLVLPVDRQVNFRIRTSDVIHSFWVAAFRIKQDAVPGILTETRTVPTRVGTYDVVCTQLCGVGHATMRQVVTVLPKPQFDRWLASRQSKGGGATASGGTAG